MAKYIAAVSGGPDSMALLHMYHKQIIAVCHVNYQKRPTADRDMLIVQEFCRSLNIPFEKLVVSEEHYKEYYDKSNNFQNVARMIRYDFFIDQAKKYHVNKVLVAHNKDDFLETALIQKKRKSKTLFLGIEKNSKYKSLGIYRPLLNKWKSEILEYCDANKIPYGIDETNELHIYERNRIRKALAILSIDERESEFQRVQKYNNEHKAKLSKIKKAYQLWELHSFSIPFYRSLPKKINEQLIYRYLVKHNIHRISFNKIKLINQFLYSDKTKTELRLGRDVWLLKIDKVLILKKKK